MKAARFAIAVVGIFALVLTACGGGGGGGLSEPNFSGKKEAAEVDRGNIGRFAYGVVGGVEVTSINDDFMLRPALPRAAKRASARTAGVAAAPGLESEHYEGDCVGGGGTLDIDFNVEESGTGIRVTVSMVADNYCDSGEFSGYPTYGYIEDGTMSITLWETLNGSGSSIVMTKWSETDSESGNSTLFDGWVKFDWPLAGEGEPSYDVNLVVVETIDGMSEEWWLRNFAMVRNIDGASWTLTGEVYYEDQGFVVLETTISLDLVTSEGQVVMHGVTTAGRLTYGDCPDFTLALWEGEDWGEPMYYNADWEADPVCE